MPGGTQEHTRLANLHPPLSLRAARRHCPVTCLAAVRVRGRVGSGETGRAGEDWPPLHAAAGEKRSLMQLSW